MCLTCPDVDLTVESGVVVVFGVFFYQYRFRRHEPVVSLKPAIYTLCLLLLRCLEANVWAYSADGVLKQHNTSLCAEVGVWCLCS